MKKNVSFQVIANICNYLTNHLYVGDDGGLRNPDPKKAHIARASMGGRQVIETQAASPHFEEDELGGWTAYAEKDVVLIRLQSASSGAILQMKKISLDKWELGFLDPRGENPPYQSGYEVIFEDPEAIPEFDSEKLFHESGRVKAS